MSMQLYIIYGNTTLDLQDAGYKLIDGFYPETPAEDAESVTERFDIFIIGSSDSDLRSKINGIRMALEHAKAHKNDALAAYLYYDVSDSGDAWMSKLLSGQILYDSKLDHRWRESKAKVSIILEHKPYWDTVDETQVPLTNGNGTNDTSGLAIFNHDDGGGASPNHHDNWATIAAADVLGDLPGPTRLEITNAFVDHLLYIVWIGQNWTDPDNFTHILEGEASSTGSEQDDEGSSGAHYMRYALGSGSEAEMFTWALSAAYLNACKGNYYKIMARFPASAPTNVKLRLKLEYNVTTVWQSGLTTIDTSSATQIKDLFTMRLPPWLLGQTDLAGLSLIMSGYQSTGGPVNVDLDFLQVTPLDGYRQLKCAGYGVAQNERMVDDAFRECKYIDDGADAKAGILLGFGSPIHLYPGKKQKLYFLLHSNIMNHAEIDRKITIKLFYHPRRQTL